MNTETAELNLLGMRPLYSMHLLSLYYSMCQSLRSHMLRSELHLPSRSTTNTRPPPKEKDKGKDKEPKSVYDAWLASREIPGQKGVYLVAGAQRQVNFANAYLAYSIIQTCAFDFVGFHTPLHISFTDNTQFKVLLELNPVRTTLMMSLNVVRSLFPAFRGYSQVSHSARTVPILHAFTIYNRP